MEGFKPLLSQYIALPVDTVHSVAEVGQLTLFEEYARIKVSTSLTQEQKKPLIMRAIIRRFAEPNRESFAQTVFPNLNPMELQNPLKESERLRLGFISGVFNPIHYGHLDAIKQAIDNMNLDRIFIIPTPATAHNEVPVEWSHRLEMARLALAGLPQVMTIDQSMLPFLQKNTGEGITELMRRYNPENHWIQIMGGDSFERFVASGHAENAVKAGRDVLVIARPGTVNKPCNLPNVYWLSTAMRA